MFPIRTFLTATLAPFRHLGLLLIPILFFLMYGVTVFAASMCVTNPEQGLCPIYPSISAASPVNSGTNLSVTLSVTGLFQYEVDLEDFYAWMVEDGTGKVTELYNAIPPYVTSSNTSVTINTGALTKSVTIYLYARNSQMVEKTVSKYITVNTLPVNGSCGASNNACTAGSLFDTADNATTYFWSCNGTGGGTNASCSLPKPVPVVNGSCGASNNACTAGSLFDTADNATTYFWSCNGTGGGTNASCSLPKPVPVVNGSCGASNNACTAGSLFDTADNATTYFWSCNGTGGGSDASCSLAIPVMPPGVPTGLTVTPQACSTGQNYLDWNDATNAASYSIYNSAGTWIANSIGSNYTHTGSLGTSYSYYVRANNSAGIQSGNSAGASGTTLGACVTPPPTPANFTATAGSCGTNRIDLAWAASAGATGYDVQIDGGAWVNQGNVLSYAHTGLVAGSSHTYAVRAWNAAGAGAGSAALTRTAPVVCAVAPTIPTVINPGHASVTQTSASLGATVQSNGGSTITSRGTCWGPAANPTTNCLAEGGTAVSIFGHTRTGFSPDTTYFYRGYAENAVGRGYSSSNSFKTATVAVTAPTLTASPLTVNAGDPTTLTWTLNGQTGCTLTGGGLSLTHANLLLSTTQSVTIGARTTFTLSCTSGGSDSVTVEVVPVGFES